MIYIIIMIALIVIGIVLISRRNYLEEFGGFLVITGLIQAGLALLIIATSYYTMVSITVYYDNVAGLYDQTIDKYNESVKDMLIAENNNAITDFSQQGYQETLGDFIHDQRYVLVEYNKQLGKKHIYKNNVFWGWLIFMPPERCVPIVLN